MRHTTTVLQKRTSARVTAKDIQNVKMEYVSVKKNTFKTTVDVFTEVQPLYMIQTRISSGCQNLLHLLTGVGAQEMLEKVIGMGRPN